jgi:ribosomal protein S18 acetylase RimI-like enzyme
MLQLIEERARKDIALAAPDACVYLHSTVDSRDESSLRLHEDCGFSPIRYHWRMQADLESAPPVVEWPKGIELRPFDREQHARALWQANNEAFRDHWGSHDIPYEEWVEDKFNDSGFDPSLWMIAWDGRSAEIAGFSLNRFRMGIGWIRNLGVRRPWRKQGLGYALLTHSFGEFYKRGMKTIGLGVDAQSPTGATRLYQKAGMYVASEFVTYEKELRPGRELEGQE